MSPTSLCLLLRESFSGKTSVAVTTEKQATTTRTSRKLYYHRSSYVVLNIFSVKNWAQLYFSNLKFDNYILHFFVKISVAETIGKHAIVKSTSASRIFSCRRS